MLLQIADEARGEDNDVCFDLGAVGEDEAFLVVPNCWGVGLHFDLLSSMLMDLWYKETCNGDTDQTL